MLLNQRLNVTNYEANRPPQFNLPAPNGLFKMLEEKISRRPQNQSNLSISYDDKCGLPLDAQLRNHIQFLSSLINGEKQADYQTHFVRSLKYHAREYVENPDEFRSLTDYIQFGLA